MTYGSRLVYLQWGPWGSVLQFRIAYEATRTAEVFDGFSEQASFLFCRRKPLLDLNMHQGPYQLALHKTTGTFACIRCLDIPWIMQKTKNRNNVSCRAGLPLVVWRLARGRKI